MLPVEKVTSHHIRYIKHAEVILTGFTKSVHYFRWETNLKLQFLPHNSPFFYLAFNNELKANKANRALFFHIKSRQPHELKPREVKSTDMQCILTTNINKCRGEKNDEEEKNARSSPR